MSNKKYGKDDGETSTIAPAVHQIVQWRFCDIYCYIIISIMVLILILLCSCNAIGHHIYRWCAAAMWCRDIQTHIYMLSRMAILLKVYIIDGRRHKDIEKPLCTWENKVDGKLISYMSYSQPRTTLHHRTPPHSTMMYKWWWWSLLLDISC